MSAPESDMADLDGKSDASATHGVHEDPLTNVDDVFKGVSDAVDVSRHAQKDPSNVQRKLDPSPPDVLTLDERLDASHVSQSDGLDADASQSDVFNVNSLQPDAFNVSQFDVLDVDASHVQDKLCALQVSSDAANAAQEDALLSVDEKPDKSQGVSDVTDATQHSQEHTSDEHGELDMSRDLLDVVAADRVQPTPARAHGDQSSVSGAVLDLVGATRPTQKDTSNLASKSDVAKAVLDLVGATQHLQEDPANVESINDLINRLKHLLLQERQTYAFMRQNSESRKMLESLHNLIQYLESQLQRLQKATHRRGLKYYLASISNKVRGHEVGRIGQSMESELQSWLDQQNVREVANIISNGSEDAQVHAISSFESVIQKGYNSFLQETILSAGLVEKLAALLAPGAASWRVVKETVFSLSALIDFNKDVFVSLVLMAKMVENVLHLMSTEPDEHALILVCVIKGMLSAGHTIVADEIYAHNGVLKIVELLDHESQALQHAAMDCVFELAYYGRVEVVDNMFKLEVVKKLALLQQSHMTEMERASTECDKYAKREEAHALDLTANLLSPALLTQTQAENDMPINLFANAVSKFALHLSIGTGLRKRDKCALKQEFLRQIKEVMEDDAEVANVTAEVLWAP
eukprot:c21564_g1_i1 orf=480-2390(+)